MISTLNMINLPVIAVIALNPTTPGTNAPAIAAFGCTVTQTGTGTWAVILNQGYPLGSYVAAGICNNGPSPSSTVCLTDGDATHKFISTQVSGSANDQNAYVIYYALPTEPLTFS